MPSTSTAASSRLDLLGQAALRPMLLPEMATQPSLFGFSLRMAKGFRPRVPVRNRDVLSPVAMRPNSANHSGLANGLRRPNTQMKGAASPQLSADWTPAVPSPLTLGRRHPGFNEGGSRPVGHSGSGRLLVLDPESSLPGLVPRLVHSLLPRSDLLNKSVPAQSVALAKSTLPHGHHHIVFPCWPSFGAITRASFWPLGRATPPP